MKRSKLWYLYFFLYLALGLYSIYNCIQLKLAFQIIRATILWFPAVIGIYFFISGHRKFHPLFWKLYFIYYLADIIYEWFWVKYYFTTQFQWQSVSIAIVYIFEVLFLLPSVIALYNISVKPK